MIIINICFILFAIFQDVFAFEAYFNSANFTHKANLTISIDGQVRGMLPIGFYAKESPKAVMNFLSQCEQNITKKNLEVLRNMNITDLENKFSFQNKSIYSIFDETMIFGNYFGTKNVQKYTVFGNSYKSEVNDYETTLGALAQMREEETGQVFSEYTILLKRASYDGPQSLWHVFGQVYSNFEFLKYLFYTGGENDGIPRRNVQIVDCIITEFMK